MGFFCYIAKNRRMMSNTIAARLACCVMMALSALVARSQTKLFTTYGEISCSFINQIMQDSRGMIWISTEDGLNRYDGVKFITYRHSAGDSNSLCHSYVKMVTEDSSGRLIIGTHDGVQVYDRGRDCFYRQAVHLDGSVYHSNVNCILERRDGEILVSGNTLVSLHETGGILTVEPVELPVPTNRLSYIAEDHDGNLWLVRNGKWLHRVTPSGETGTYSFIGNEGSISCLCVDTYGNVIVGTGGNGLFVYRRQSDDFAHVEPEGITGLRVKSILSDSRTGTLIGSDGNGIFSFNSKDLTLKRYPFGNSQFNTLDSKIHSILCDNSGNLWVAVYQKGVMMIPGQVNNFHYIGAGSVDADMIGDACVNAIRKDGSGILWVGTDNDGLYRIDPSGRIRHYAAGKEAPATVMSIFEDSRGTIWIGSYLKGLHRLDRRTDRIEHIWGLIDQDGKEAENIYSFAEDGDGRIWVASMGNGLFCLDPVSGKVFGVPAEKIQNNWITSLHYSPSGRLYIGTYDGAGYLELSGDGMTGKWLSSREIVYSIHEDGAGRLWLGTDEGLHLLNPRNGEGKLLKTEDGLPNNAVYAVCGDGAGDIWTSSNSGLSRYSISDGKFINYYYSDGLQGNEFSKGASFRDNDGNLWFGGTNGVTWFNPKEITVPPKIWTPRITGLYVGGAPVRMGMKSGHRDMIDSPVEDAERIELGYRQNSLSVEFSTLELNSPERLQWQYRLGGNWVTLPHGQSTISLIDLAPGRHTLSFRALDYDKASPEKTFAIWIRNPWWSSWWAVLVYVAFGAFAVWDVRRRILSRRNLQKIETFTNLSHEIRNPMSLIISPVQKLLTTDRDPSRQFAYRSIMQNSERIVRLMDQMMDAQKIDKGQMNLHFRPTDLVPFVTETASIFDAQAEERGIDFTFRHDGIDGLVLWADRSGLDKIIVNILSNAFKFTGDSGRISIILSEDKGMAVLRFTDSGIGMSEDERKHIFDRFWQAERGRDARKGGAGIGMNLTRSLVRLHHGSISVEANPDGPGTQFTVRLPEGRAHLKPEQISLAEEPLEDKRLADKEPEAGAARPRRTGWRRQTVMIVEDDDEIRNYILTELSAEYRVICCGDGQEALEMALKERPELIVSDVMMPGMDGFELCRRVRKNINLNSTPVILLTAKSDTSDNAQGLDSGADAYLTKPFNMEILSRTISNLLRSRARLKNVYGGSQDQEGKVEKLTLKSPNDKLMERIMRVINDNLGNPYLKVEDITREVGISRVHLHRKLKEMTNYSTRDFIRNLRLNQAARLLRESRHSIAEVSDLTGFSNPNYFSTVFSQTFGMSPSEYMKKGS